MGDRVRPGAPAADLAAVAGGGAVLRAELAGVVRAERREHRQRRLVPGAQARLRLGRARDRVLLEQPVGVLAPARALPDQLDLGRALAGHRALDRRRDSGATLAPVTSESGRALVAEDPRVAVGIGADRGRGCPGRRAPGPRSSIGCSAPGYSGYDSIRSKSLLGCVRSTSNSGTNTTMSPPTFCAKAIGRSFERKLKPVVVLDVRLVEEDDAAQPLGAGVVEQALAPLGELGRAGCRSPARRRTISACSAPARALNHCDRVHAFASDGAGPADRAAVAAGGLLERADELAVLDDRLDDGREELAAGTSSCSEARPASARRR